MLIVNNSANFSSMPAFGGIALSPNLVFGLRATSPTNTVNLSDKPDKAVITSNTVKYSTAGIIGNSTNFLGTSFAPPSKSLTIKSVIKFKGMPVDSPVVIGVFGDLIGNSGIGLLLSTIANNANFDYELRLYVGANNGTNLRNPRFKFAVDKKITDSETLNVWIKIDDDADTISLKVGDSAWMSFVFSGDNLANRADGNWQIGRLPRFDTGLSSSVIISELLVWDKILTSAEIDQQDKLSQRWLSTLA
ncbi:hypothetical protein [Psychrobacter sp.]|uniref:hypothetical protein n=1 Tax=Psychrobacter sp. TaxID=56811 RepID=UPI003C792DAF